MTPSKNDISNRGKQHVLSRLHECGMLASLTTSGRASVISVRAPDGSVVANLYVRATTQGLARGWTMQATHESYTDDHSFWAFVDLKPEVPVTYVMRGRRAAEVAQALHAAWLAIPGRNGQPHQDNTVRKVMPSPRPSIAEAPPGWIDEYKEAWHLLVTH
jgi:hypothetical protein